MDGAVEDGTDPLQDGADLWYCMACGDAFPRLDIAPLYTDQHGLTYCRECLEPLFLPIADGDETGGLPRVGDDILSDVPGVMEGIDPELRERFLAGLAIMRDAAPVHRIYCSGPASNGEGTCNDYLGRRARVAGDVPEDHEWKSCPSCQRRKCMVCEVEPSEDNPRCSLPQIAVDWNRQHDSEERGERWQLCPACDRSMFKGIGCNEMRCICGQHFCFVCGRGFDLIDDLRRHFSQPVPDWCPYYNLPDNPAAVYRDAWTDPRSEGGWHFPELLPGGRIMGDNAKQVALLDRSIRQYRRTVIGGTEIEQYCVRGLLLAARHVLALMHSREIREEQATAMDVEGIHERLRFAHFASIYRCFLQQLATCENHAAMLPTTTSLSTTPIDWYGHFSKMRRLCLRDMATEQHWRERKEDYSVLQDKIAEAWRYGGYDEDLPAPDSVSQDQRPRAQTRLRAKELLRCLRELLALLSANSRNRFSASRSFYLINKSAAVARLLHEIETSGAAAFRDSGPDTRLAYDAACFLAQRLLEEEREELEHWVSDADSRAMHVSRMWAREIALVCLEVKDEISPSPLPADIIELGDSARRLQIIVHDHYRTTDAKDELYDLWHQYTHHGHADRILPNPGDGPLKPLFFKLLASLQYIKERWDAPVLEEEGFPDSSDGPDPRRGAESPRVHGAESPRVRGRTEMDLAADWRWLRGMVDDVYGWTAEEYEQHVEDPQFLLTQLMLDLGSGILHHDYPDWRRNTWLAGFYKLQDVLEAWRAQPARQNPVPRFEPGEPRHRMERFLSDLVGVLRERFGMYERPPESNDDQTGGAWLPTTWGQHYATVLGISRHLMYRRLLQDDEDENVIAELRRHLDMAAHLLRNMWNNEWLVQESVANRWRLQRLEVLVASWRREGGGAALPRFARDDEVMMLMILDGLTTAMRRRYLETDQRAEEEAAAYGGESGAGDLVLGRPADVAPLETAMSEGPGLNRRLVRSSSFSPPPEHRQEELEDDLVDVASDGASLGDSSDGREAELLGLATSDTSD